MIKTFLFDFDGVLVDTMKIQTDSLVESIKNYCNFQKFSKHDMETINSAITTRKKIDYFCDKGLILKKDKEAIYQMKKKIADKKMLEIEPMNYTEKVAILKTLKKNDYSVGVVTNANKNSTVMLLEHLNMADFVDVLITNSDVREPKPAPEPYRMAMQKLQSSPHEVVIFEDSETGLQSALQTTSNVVKIESVECLDLEMINKIQEGKYDFYIP
jgi:HAD superfamily hydrolase (TIGR01509 family)